MKADKDESFGQRGERIVAEEYRKKGFKIVGRNVKMIGYKQLGEIDVIGVKGKLLVFVEVKSRQNENFMPTLEAINWRKQRKLLKAVKAFLLNNKGYEGYQMRMDVATVHPALDGKFYKCTIIEDAIQDIS